MVVAPICVAEESNPCYVNFGLITSFSNTRVLVSFLFFHVYLLQHIIIIDILIIKDGMFSTY
jgi:hypothetical protein